MTNPLTAGKAAREAGVNVETLRYYERRGLLPRPVRSASNYRLYTPETVGRLRFIKRAQELGFSLGEISGLLALRARPGARGETVRSRTLAKVREIDRKLSSLQSIRSALLKLARACPGKGPLSSCPIMQAMDDRPGNPRNRRT